MNSEPGQAECKTADGTQTYGRTCLKKENPCLCDGGEDPEDQLDDKCMDKMIGRDGDGIEEMIHTKG